MIKLNNPTTTELVINLMATFVAGLLFVLVLGQVHYTILLAAFMVNSFFKGGVIARTLMIVAWAIVFEGFALLLA